MNTIHTHLLENVAAEPAVTLNQRISATPWRGKVVYVGISYLLCGTGTLGLIATGVAWTSQKEIKIPFWLFGTAVVAVSALTCVSACALRSLTASHPKITNLTNSIVEKSESIKQTAEGVVDTLQHIHDQTNENNNSLKNTIAKAINFLDKNKETSIEV